MRIGFLGPEGTFSHQALLDAQVPSGAEAVAVATIYGTVMAVHDGAVDLALVPIENALEGSVDVTLDTLASDADAVTIIGETVQRIRNCLIAAGDVAIDAIALDISFIAIDVAFRRDVAIYQDDGDFGAEASLGWERRPAAISAALAPGDPCGGPGDAGDPDPAEGGMAIPSAVVVADVAPLGFIVFGDPGPAVVGIFPVTDGVGLPVGGPAVWGPASAVAFDVDPIAVGIEIFFVNGDDRGWGWFVGFGLGRRLVSHRLLGIWLRLVGRRRGRLIGGLRVIRGLDVEGAAGLKLKGEGHPRDGGETERIFGDTNSHGRPSSVFTIFSIDKTPLC